MNQPNTTPPRIYAYIDEVNNRVTANFDKLVFGQTEYISKVEVESKLLEVREGINKIRMELEPAITNGDSEGEISHALNIAVFIDRKIDDLLKENV